MCYIVCVTSHDKVAAVENVECFHVLHVYMYVCMVRSLVYVYV